jgi:hypothetical protein
MRSFEEGLMRRILHLGLFIAIAGIVLSSRPATLSAAPPLTDDDVARLRKVIRPLASEDPFETIPWETSLWDARIKAAKTGKPILLWEMDGHPLGCG